MAILLLTRSYDVFSFPVESTKIISPEEAVLMEEKSFSGEVLYETEEDYIAFCACYNERFKDNCNVLYEHSSKPHYEWDKIDKWVYPADTGIRFMRNRTYIYVEGITLLRHGTKNKVSACYALALAPPATITLFRQRKIYPVLKYRRINLENEMEAGKYFENLREKIKAKYFVAEQPPIMKAIAEKPFKNKLPIEFLKTGYTNEFSLQEKYGYVIEK